MRAPVLALDIGGTKLAAAVVAADGEVRNYARAACDASGDGERLFASLIELAVRVMDGATASVTGIGAGCGGPMRFPDGVVSPLHIPAWRDFPLRARLAERFGLPCVVDNDAKAMALGEWWLGAGRGRRNMLGMVVSTGVGGGLIVDGRLLDGEHGHAGHIGHVIVWPGGPVCRCGASGCVGAVASGTGIAARFAEARQSSAGAAGASLGAREIADAARSGDLLARRLFEDAGTALGRGIASVEALCDLELVVLGGSVALGAWDLIERPLRDELTRSSRIAFGRDLRVMRAELGERAGVLGAARLAFDRADEGAVFDATAASVPPTG